MNFYRIKCGKKLICFRTNEAFFRQEDVIDYAKKRELTENSELFFEVEKIFEVDYIKYLMNQLYIIFEKEFEEFKAKLEKCSIDEICDKWDDIAVRKDVMYILSDSDPDEFDFIGLEQRLAMSEKCVQEIYDAMINKEHSDYMDFLIALLNKR